MFQYVSLQIDLTELLLHFFREKRSSIFHYTQNFSSIADKFHASQ